MTQIGTAVRIDAPPARVWQVMRDVERWPEWTPGVTSVEIVGGGPLALGSRVRVRQPKLPPVEWTVTELIEDRGFTWVAQSPGARVAGHHLIEPEGTGSRVMLELQYEGPVARLVARLSRKITEQYIALEARGLKARSEEPPGG